MLKRIAERVVERLINKGIVEKERKAVYMYGCELLFSTVLTVAFILGVGFVTEYLLQTVVFLLAFMPIRTVANGYHASSYRNCFLLTSLLAFFCIAAGRMCGKSIPVWLMWGAFITAQCIIWARGPFRSRVHPLKAGLIERNKTYMHRIQLLEVLAAILLTAAGGRIILDTVVMATIMVALMIYIAEKEEDKNVGVVSNAD